VWVVQWLFESRLSTLIAIINIHCSEMSYSTDFLVCVNIATWNNGSGAREMSVNFSNSVREFSVKFGIFSKLYHETTHFPPWIRLVHTYSIPSNKTSATAGMADHGIMTAKNSLSPTPTSGKVALFVSRSRTLLNTKYLCSLVIMTSKPTQPDYVFIATRQFDTNTQHYNKPNRYHGRLNMAH